MSNRTFHQRTGLILLVVLSMLAFLSLLVVTYVAFTSQSQRTAHQVASREFRAPNVDTLFDNAMMKLVRGSNDTADPFYGEDLLSDLYGRKGGRQFRSLPPGEMGDGGGNNMPERRPMHVGSGFVRFPVDFEDANFGYPPGNRPAETGIDDYYAGRVITFLQGPLRNRSFRVLRSVGVRPINPPVEYANTDSFFIELDPNETVTLGNGTTVQIEQLISASGGGATPTEYDVSVLFYAPGANGSWGAVGANADDDGQNNVNNPGEAGYAGTDDVPYAFYMNSTPLNSPGIGLASGNISQTHQTFGQAVPVSFLPNRYAPGVAYNNGGTNVPKQNLGGDFDESYDAPDYNNWFLSGRARVPVDADNDGNVDYYQDVPIPSFHRPSLINYLVNLTDWESNTTETTLRDVVETYRRATYRPLAIDNPDFTVNTKFTGGNSQYSLRTPIQIPLANPDPTQNPVPHVARLDLLTESLVNGPWDVDNDGDGVADSVWIDLGLPLITSPEGKLLRPLVAPMIEDTGGKLNLNAHGNYAQNTAEYRDAPQNAWAQTTSDTGRNVFRGLGYGPAEIALPSAGATATGMNADASAIASTELFSLLRKRKLWGMRPQGTAAIWAPAGINNNDVLDNLRTGARPATHTANGGYGFSVDPFGYGGVGVGRGGQLLAARAGDSLPTPSAQPPQLPINETINDPYETDPTGQLNGDSVYTLDDLEAILRNNSWDTDVLPQRLRGTLQTSLANKPEIAKMLTTLSTSFDFPTAIPASGDRAAYNNPVTLMIALLERLDVTLPADASTQPNKDTVHTINDQLRRILAPELLTGRKLDVNRPLGNGVDDNGNDVIDEPLEFVLNSNYNDTNGNNWIDDAGEFRQVAATAAGDNNDNDNDGSTDERGEMPLGFNAQGFPMAAGIGGNIGSEFNGRIPDYVFGRPDGDLSMSGRELLARHLYVLMMALRSENEFPVEDDTTIDDRDEYDARRIAQWAVNVVDYRDPDSIMTRFQYDPDPLDGWDVAFDGNNDGTIDAMNDATIDGNGDGTPPAEPSPVVWGVVSPELVFSEGHAFHDLRVRDSKYETTGATGEFTDQEQDGTQDTDQIRIPQGSLFLELFCNRAVPNGDVAHRQGVPQELYELTGATNQYELDLQARAPTASGKEIGAPVWRIAISEPHYENSPNDELNPVQLRQNFPDTVSYDPERPLEVDDDGGAAGAFEETLQYDRFILFQHFDETTDNDGDPATVALNHTADAMSSPSLTVSENQLFFAHNDDNSHAPAPMRRLAPGEHLALAPRTTTHLGSQVYPQSTPPEGPSVQRFVMDTNEGILQYDLTDTRTTPATGNGDPIAPALPLRISTFQPDTYADQTTFENGRFGVSVSEPLRNDYYLEPLYEADDYPSLTDGYVDLDTPTDGSAKDRPEDLRKAEFPIAALSYLKANPQSIDDWSDIPQADVDAIQDPFVGTEPEYCSVFLQRLADPTRPYDPMMNKYVTVDWMPLDLTVFSGEEDPAKLNSPGGAAPTYATQMRERNGHQRSTPATPAGILFSYETEDPLNAPGEILIGDNYFEFDTTTGTLPASQGPSFESTLGYLNGFGTTTQHFGNTLGNAANMSTADRGHPQTPFSMHHWLNRPFASHYELMMVPASSSGRLFHEFAPNANAANPVYPDDSTTLANTDVEDFRGRHPHLLNFFQNNQDEDNAAQFPRIFDYVSTLPPFRGEVDLVNPSRVQPLAGGTVRANASQFFTQTFRPPFNNVYDNRRQGQINVNTLVDYPVWTGLMHGHLTASELGSAENDSSQDLSFQAFRASRRGYPVPSGSMHRLVQGGSVNSNTPDRYNFGPTQFNGDYPTQFAGVYRNINDADLAPTAPTITGNTDLRRRGVSGSLFREDADPGTGATQDTPMFEHSALTESHRNPNRFPWMKHQTLMRMPNLATNQSQVFVVRMTLGFFEVDSGGLNLGKEYKADVAENKRYQMLYIIDRSKPVGFIPGRDLNVRDTVIYERRIE